MKAGHAVIGNTYHSPKGALVTVAALKERRIVLKINETNTEVLVSKSYPLRQCSAVASHLRIEATKPDSVDLVRHEKKRPIQLSSLIDPLLLEGKRSNREIVVALRKRLGEFSDGKDLAANVRARIYHLKRKGMLA